MIGGIESLMTGMAESLATAGKEVLVLADGKENLDLDTKTQYSIKRFDGWKPLRRIRKARYLKKNQICWYRSIKD